MTDAAQNPTISAYTMQRELTTEIENIFSCNLKFRSDYELADLAQMLKECPINRVAVSIIALMTLTEFGEYHHSDTQTYYTPNGYTTVQDWVRSNFETMKGSLPTIIARIIKQAYSLGCSCSEIIWTTHKGEWRLYKIKILNPLKYNFKKKANQIEGITFHTTQKTIPYQKLIHIYSASIEEPDDAPEGDPQAARAYPYFHSRQEFFKQWSIAGRRQATGLLVVQAPGDRMVAILNEKGEPIKKDDGSIKTQNAIYATVAAAKATENGSVLGTDINHKVSQIPSNAGERFFEHALQYYQKMIFYAYGIPSTIFDDTASGIGNAGINEGHRMILDSQIKAIVASIRDEILEKVIRPLLIANFGNKFEENLGEFKVEKELDPAAANSRILNLSLAISNGIISTKDIEAVNKLREDLGLTALSAEEFQQQVK